MRLWRPRSTRLTLVSLFLVSLVGIQSASAIVYTFLINPGGSSFIRTDGGFSLGTKLTVGSSDLIVTQLGIWDNNSDGLIQGHDAGIWNWDTSQLLGSVTIPSGTAGTLIGEFRYVALTTPVYLSAGSTYVFGAYYPGGEAFWEAQFNNTTLTTDANNYWPAYNTGGSLAMPGSLAARSKTA